VNIWAKCTWRPRNAPATLSAKDCADDKRIRQRTFLYNSPEMPSAATGGIFVCWDLLLLAELKISITLIFI
jgi:hypothetical protein